MARVPGECTRDADRSLVGHALGVHEVDEICARKRPLDVKDRNIEILVESDAALLPFANDVFVPPLKIFGVEIEALDGRLPLLSVPSIRAQHSADVEKDVSDFGHDINTARAGAPSHPSILRGRQMNSYSPAGGNERSSPSTITTECPSNVRCVRWWPEWNCSMER